MKRRRAAAPYAKALSAFVKERNQTELVGRELGDIAATFESVTELWDFFARRWIQAGARRPVAAEIDWALGPLEAHRIYIDRIRKGEAQLREHALEIMVLRRGQSKASSTILAAPPTSRD